MGGVSILRSRVVAEARSYLGTPYHHQGRVKGLRGGVDCIGPIVGVACALKIPYEDVVGYPQIPDGITLCRVVERHTRKKPIGTQLPGDILVLWIMAPGVAQHLAWVTDRGMLHCWIGPGKVVEHTYSAVWRRRTVGVYEIPGIKDG